jgi:DNA-binding NtrC family response regulator
LSGVRILVVEDRASLRGMLRKALEKAGHRVEEAGDGAAGVERLAQQTFDLVLTDLKLPGASGLEVLRASRRSQPATPVVVMTAYGTVGTAVDAMKAGAVDFLEKPVELDDLYRVVSAAVGAAERASPYRLPDGTSIVGSHPRLLAALRLVERVAPTDSTVLITGQSGTGKELVARAIHAESRRSGGPFVAVNCAAIPDTLLENELFGHEKGAYTGAGRREAGRFEQARGGTLLLDEIGELALGVQSKVLRVLEERTFERVGGSRSITADVRLVAATNRELDEMVAEGSFRSDLYYRLNVFPIPLPTLAERRSDIAELARHLVERAAARSGRGAVRVEPAALERLAEADWPGNVRQLANVLERAVILCDGPRLTEADVVAALDPLAGDPEEGRLRAALEASGGDKKRAAAALGISYRTLLRRLERFD